MWCAYDSIYRSQVVESDILVMALGTQPYMDSRTYCDYSNHPHDYVFFTLGIYLFWDCLNEFFSVFLMKKLQVQILRIPLVLSPGALVYHSLHSSVK